jgi:signal transduction histidine kinase
VVEAVLPADRPALVAAVRRCLREDAPMEIEFRVAAPPGGGSDRGSVRWLRVTGRAQRQGPGPPSGVHGVIADVSARKRAEAERLELLRRLAQAQEEVQRRIARELHDQVGQTVTGLSLGLKGLERMLAEEGQRQQVRWLQGLTGEIGRDIHRAAADLRPTALDDLGLHEALLAYCSAWSERCGIAVDVQAIGSGDDDRRRLPMEIETVLYRIVQEALTNVLKHAGARNVSVVLERKDGVTRLIVEDDGRGFDPDALPHADAREGRRHLGLLGIRERLSLVGGTLTVESAPGAGTTLFVQVPSATRIGA